MRSIWAWAGLTSHVQPARLPSRLSHNVAAKLPPNQRGHRISCSQSSHQTARNQRGCQASRRIATVKPLILQRSLSQNAPTTHRGSRLFKLFARFVPNCAKNS